MSELSRGSRAASYLLSRPSRAGASSKAATPPPNLSLQPRTFSAASEARSSPLRSLSLSPNLRLSPRESPAIEPTVSKSSTCSSPKSDQAFHSRVADTTSEILEYYAKSPFFSEPLVIQNVDLRLYRALDTALDGTDVAVNHQEFNSKDRTLSYQPMPTPGHQNAIAMVDREVDRVGSQLMSSEVVVDEQRVRNQRFSSVSVMLYDRDGTPKTVYGIQPDGSWKFYLEDLSEDTVWEDDPNCLLTVRKNEVPDVGFEVGIYQTTSSLNKRISKMTNSFLSPTRPKRFRCVLALDIIIDPNARTSSGDKRKAGQRSAPLTGHKAIFYVAIRKTEQDRNVQDGASDEDMGFTCLEIQRLYPADENDSEEDLILKLPAICFVPSSFLKPGKKNHCVDFDLRPLKKAVVDGIEDIMDRLAENPNYYQKLDDKELEDDYGGDFSDFEEMKERATKKANTYDYR